MKCRVGFVSNSSSASFIVKWKFNKDKEEFNTLDTALYYLFDVWDNNGSAYDQEKGIINLEKCDIINEDVIKTIKHIRENTTKNDNVYITDFFTTMLNSLDDFGIEAKTFLFHLMLDSKANNNRDLFNITTMYIERD
ncbi:MAG: hypothetical protein AABY32_02305 [Nanoarchaeota archaeon]